MKIKKQLFQNDDVSMLLIVCPICTVTPQLPGIY